MSGGAERWQPVRALLRARAGDPAPSRGTPDGAPASFAQEQLWRFDRLSSGSSAYNLAVALRLRGSLDVEALRRALRDLVERHPALRTTLVLSHGRLVQRLRAVAIELALTELREEEIDTWVERLVNQRFDLRRGPVLRVALARLAPQDHCLVLVVHHTAFDAWSFEILMHELDRAYLAQQAGRSCEFPLLPIGYGDYARWQRELIARGARATSARYWRDRLTGAVPLARLDGRGPPGTAPVAGALRRRLSGGATRRLREVSAREGVSLYTLLLAALAASLRRGGAGADFVIGSPVAVRARSELTPLVGMLTNTLPLRIDAPGEPTLRALLVRADEVARGAFAHQDLPLELIAADSPHLPSFEVLFAFQNVPRAPLRLGGLTVEGRSVSSNRAKCDLTFTLQDDEAGLGILLEYDAHRFSAAQAGLALDRLEAALADYMGDLELTIDSRVPPPAAAASRPHDPLDRTVLDAFERVLGRRVGVDDSFFAQGGTSLGVMRLLTELERTTGKLLPTVTVFQRPTVLALSAALRGLRPVEHGALVPIRSGRSLTPLYLMAGGRGGRDELAIYGKLLGHLDADKLVFGMTARADADSVEAQATALIELVRMVQPRGPYELGGECVGGVVAYEMASQLLAQGEEIDLLLLMDTWCPSTAGTIHRRYWGQPRALLRAGIGFLVDLPVRAPSAEPWWQELRRRARVSPEARRYVRACMDYRPRPLLHPLQLLASESNIRRGIATPWRALTGDRVTVRAVPGDHESYSRRYATAAAEQLRRCLEEPA